MPTKTIEQRVSDLDGRLRSRALADVGPVTISHGRSLDFEEAVRTTLVEHELLSRRQQRGAWIDRDRERVVRADVEHLHWMAEFRDRRR